jgi:hypothetical protein
MPLRDHPVFVRSPESEATLWRYLSLPKYLSFLQERSLYFSSLEVLARDDPFEGVLPASRFRHRQWKDVSDVPPDALAKLERSMTSIENGLQAGLDNYKSIQELRIRQAFAYRKSYYVNCWHLNDQESAAMWQLYSRNDEGIALVARQSALEGAFKRTKKQIMAGLVQYEDYADELFLIDDDNGFRPILHKRKSFAHEREFRLVFWDTSVTHAHVPIMTTEISLVGSNVIQKQRKAYTSVGRSVDEVESMQAEPGLLIECDIDKLLDAVYVSPLAPDWFYQVVCRVSERYDAPQPKRSSLSAQPLR